MDDTFTMKWVELKQTINYNTFKEGTYMNITFMVIVEISELCITSSCNVCDLVQSLLRGYSKCQKNGFSNEGSLHVKWPASAISAGLSQEAGCSQEGPLKRVLVVFEIKRF